jgi:transposase
MARASRAVWAKRVERWKDSGLTAKQFAGELGVSAQSLTFWRWKLRRDGAVAEGGREAVPARKRRSRAAATPTFVQLVPTACQVPRTSMLEIVLANGLAVRLSPQFDEATLLRVVALLGGQT